MQDISGFGLQLRIIASNTFPAGFTVTQFADDGDPLDVPSIQLADKAMGLNGDLIVFSKAMPILLTINLVPNGDDDSNMAILAEANRVGKGKLSARDVITLVAIYPDGKILSLLQGKLTDAPSSNSVSSAGRYKSKAYAFAFENRIGT